MADALHFSPFDWKFRRIAQGKRASCTRGSFCIWFPSHIEGISIGTVIVLCQQRSWMLVGEIIFPGFDPGHRGMRSLGSFHLSLDQDPSEGLLNWALHMVTTRYKASQLPGHCLQIISFDIARETVVEIPLTACGSLDICNCNLVVLGQCLSAAVCGSDGSIELWIMKECDVKKLWIKDYVIGAYLPFSLNQTAGRPLYSRPWKKSKQSKGAVQVVGTLKNGETLLQYMNGELVSYNPQNEEFEDLVIPGLLNGLIVHVENLFSFQEIQRFKEL